MKTSKVQPLYLTLHPSLVAGWEKVNLPTGLTLKKIANRNFMQLFVIAGIMITFCLFLILSKLGMTGWLPVLGLLLAVVIVSTERNNNKLQKFASRFEEEAKGLGLTEVLEKPWNVSFAEDTKEKLIYLAYSVLMAQQIFKETRLDLKVTRESVIRCGENVDTCIGQLKLTIKLAISFGLSDGNETLLYKEANERIGKFLGNK